MEEEREKKEKKGRKERKGSSTVQLRSMVAL